jgi:hypothetical protein
MHHPMQQIGAHAHVIIPIKRFNQASDVIENMKSALMLAA